MRELTLQEAFSEIPPVTIDMMAFAERNNLICTFNSKPETNGCAEATFYRINLRDNFLGVPENMEVRTLLFAAKNKKTGQFLIVEIDNRADKRISTNKICRALKDVGIKIKMGDKLEVENILGLTIGEINALSVRFMARQKNIPVLLVVTDELYNQKRPFSHNCGKRNNGVIFDDSNAFYQAFVNEQSQEQTPSEFPNVVVLPLRLIAATRATCHTR